MEKTDYLAEAKRAAVFTSRHIGETPAKSKLRLNRALAYAEWRWDGYRDGKISSL